jgi:general secretion pathway protein G
MMKTEACTHSPHRFRPDAGVTLVEMMVVIVIIGLITAIVAINVLPAQTTARVEKAKADLRTLEQALELFHLDQSRYPTTEEGLESLTQAPAPDAQGLTRRTEPYVRRLPADPWGRPYIYVMPGADGRPYDLSSLGADGKDGGEAANADIRN